MSDPTWSGVLCPEGKESGDGRMFATDALTWRDLPLPLLWQEETDIGHDGSVVVARIDRIWRDGDLIHGEGIWHDTEAAAAARALVDGGFSRGISVDVDAAEVEFRDPETGEPLDDRDDWFEMDEPALMVVTKGRIAAATLVAIPAFQEAMVTDSTPLATTTEPVQAGTSNPTPFTITANTSGNGVTYSATFNPPLRVFAVSDAPWGDFTAADYTNEQWRDATLIHLDPAEGQDPLSKDLHRLPVYEPNGNLNRGGVHAAASVLGGGRGGLGDDVPDDKIEAAATTLIGLYTNELDETPPDSLYEAAGKEPPADSEDSGSGEEEAALTVLRAAAARSLPAPADFADPHLDGPTPLTVTHDGRVYGHLATWGVCHVGFDGTCVTPPKSQTGYAYFMTGEVQVAGGAAIPVGQITIDTGHAPPAASSRAAAAHYENTGAVVADVAAGEDDHGIWVAGRIRPGTDPERVTTLRAAALSGDWRRIGGSLELVAALAVNVPGFPIPRVAIAASGRRQMTLVASGVVERPRAPHGPTRLTANLDAETVARAVVKTIRRRDRVEAVTKRMRRTRVAAASARMRRG